MKHGRTNYCGRCGERIVDGDSFCRNCGAPVEEQAPRRSPSRRWKTIAVAGGAAAAVALVAVAGWLLASRVTGSPVTRFVSYHTALFSDRVQKPLQAVEANRTPGELSADITITGSVDNEELSAYLDGSSVTLKADVHDDRVLLGGEIDLLGSTVLNGTVTYEDGRLGVYLPELDQNYYVMDLAPAAGDAAGQTPDLSGPPLPSISLDELGAAIRPYWDAITALVNEKNITLEKDVPGVLRLLPFDEPCQVYAFQPQQDSLEALVMALADLLEQDGGLRDILREFMSSAAVQLGVSGLGAPDAADSLDSALDWTAGSLRGNSAAIAKELADAGFTWSIAVQDDTVRQVKLAIHTSDPQAEAGLAYEIVRGGEDSLDEAAYVFSGGDIWRVFDHHRTGDGQTASGTVELFAGDAALLTLAYSGVDGRVSPLDLPYGSYTVRADGMDADLSLTVADDAAGGTDHVLSLSGAAEQTNGLFNDVDLTVHAVAGSTVQPPEPVPVDVTDYSDEQMEEIIDAMKRAFRNDLLANLWPLLRHAW